jgi:plastocyanin
MRSSRQKAARKSSAVGGKILWSYLAVAGLVVLMVLVIAGCAPAEEDLLPIDDPEEILPPPDEEPDEEPPAEEETIMITASPGVFNPDVITVQSGVTVNLVIENTGAENHTFTVDELGIDVLISPGTEEEITFTVDEAGVYEYYCAIPGHREAGMFGTLIVE